MLACTSMIQHPPEHVQFRTSSEHTRRQEVSEISFNGGFNVLEESSRSRQSSWEHVISSNRTFVELCNRDCNIREKTTALYSLVNGQLLITNVREVIRSAVSY